MMEGPGESITNEERARRLHRVYRLLAQLASENEAASGDDPGENVPMAASDPGEKMKVQQCEAN